MNFLIAGYTEGFDPGIRDIPLLVTECKNNRSATTQPAVVKELIHSEVSKGYLLGPYVRPPFEAYRISPIGIAEGKYSKKKRLIVDLSAPYDKSGVFSVNELIDKKECSMSYDTIDDAINLILKYGQGAVLNKFDLRDAFKVTPIKQEFWKWFGIKWDNRYYFYHRLCFGCRSSPKQFDYLSTAACWIAHNNYSIKDIIHLLDDFLTVDQDFENGYRSMAILTMLFKKLGMPLNLKKTIGPVTELEYLGIILDSVKMQARLPEDKVLRLKHMLIEFCKVTSCSKVELLSLLGHMNFASKVIIPGRSFMSYLLYLTRGISNNSDRITLNDDCRRNMQMWIDFLDSWNGVSFFIDSTVSNMDIQLYTDAASTKGFGGYLAGRWFYGAWPDDLINYLPEKKTLSIAFLELYPIVMAAVLWGSEWTKKRIVFHTDNKAVTGILRKGRSRCSNIMLLMRRLTWCAAVNNFCFKAAFVEGCLNTVSDSLSRFQIARFRQLAPQAQETPEICVPFKE